MRADPRLDELDLLERLSVDHEDAARLHVRQEEQLAVRGHAYVLRHAAFRELEVSEDLPSHEIDLHQAALELAREDRVAPVDREVGMVDAGALWGRQRALERHRLRITEIEPFESLGDHDGRPAVG